MRVGAVSAVVAVVAVLALAGCSSSESSEQAVFSFADDDLCEWVSEEEVAEFVAAEFDWEGTAVVDTRRSEEATCQWALSVADPGSDVRAESPAEEVVQQYQRALAEGEVVAMDAGQWKDFDGNPYVISYAEVSEYEAGTLEIGASVVGHPAVSDGVVVHNAGFGQFALGVPPDGEWLHLSLNLPIGEFEWDAEYEAQYFAVADHFVEELGWLDGE